MATQLRSVNTKFWEDPWIETLSVNEKLLFLYLITNSYANLAGIYEISIKRICFETGLSDEMVSNGLKRFGMVKKAYFVCGNYIFLPNWLKNQNLNLNMKKNVLKTINELPINVKISILGNHYKTIQKDYQMVLNTLLKYEDEKEDEKEDEGEEENDTDNITISDFPLDAKREYKNDDDRFVSFFNQYEKNVGYELAAEQWSYLSRNEQNLAMMYLADYKISTPELKFRLNPANYLSQKKWNDSILPKETDNQQSNEEKKDISTDWGD